MSSVPLTQGEVELQKLVQDPIKQFREAWEANREEPNALVTWLKEQYIGEREAVASMEALYDSIKKQSGKEKFADLVEKVIRDEHRHVAMITELLESREVTPPTVEDPEVLDGMDQ